MSEHNHWQDDPSLKGFSSEKLQYLTQMMGEMNGKDPQAILPFLMGLSSGPKNGSTNFSDQETELILQVLKKRMTPEEQSKIDMLRTIARMISQQGHRPT